MSCTLRDGADALNYTAIYKIVNRRERMARAAPWAEVGMFRSRGRDG